MSQTRDQVKHRLAAEALRSGLHLHLRATGSSMLPTLWPGDRLTIESVTVGQVVPGDLVLYMREGRFFVHRLIKKLNDNSLITRGDCLADPDAPVPAQEFLGKVVQVQRDGMKFAPSSRLVGVRLLVARLLCYFNPVQQLALRFHTWHRAAHFDLTLVEDAC